MTTPESPKGRAPAPAAAASPPADDEVTQIFVGSNAQPDPAFAPTLILRQEMLAAPHTVAPNLDPVDPVPAPAPAPGPGPAPVRLTTLPNGGRRPSTLPNSDAQNASGAQQVGRYLVLDRLGRGGMATVYKARDPDINRDLAIKFLHASLCEDATNRARFLQEARAAGGLSHPNIVTVHDVGEIQGRPFMAMELLDGVSLADELEHNKTLPLREVVEIGIQLGRALDYAHSRGIVHRDIKPGNIMRVSGGRAVKVTDFGIAHSDDVADDSVQRTRVGDVLGTPQYMSPEQTRGEILDGRSDLFSVGIVLYQMIAGARPFRGDSLVAVATRIANDEPPPIDKQREGVPASLRRVIERCLAKPLARRFQTGAELADALTKVLAEMDEAAHERSRKRSIPLRVQWAGTMALIVALVMGVTTAVITQRQHAAMMNQVNEYGTSLARFIAAQNAAAVLGEDWESVEVAVEKMMRTRNFESVTVADAGGVVRVSSQAGRVGQPFLPTPPNANSEPTRSVVAGEPVLAFEEPITFQDKVVGRVALGIPEKPLTQVARLSITLMIVLAVVTVLAVAIAMYFVADWFAKPIKLLGESMNEIAKGRFDHRIGEQRSDEFGQLYERFDAMAQALQARSAADAPAGPTPASADPDGTRAPP